MISTKEKLVFSLLDKMASAKKYNDMFYWHTVMLL